MTPTPTETLQLRDIHLPATPDIWPPAPGWWLLALLGLFLLLWIGLKTWRYIILRQQRKRILALLEKIQQSSTDLSSSEFIAQLSRLMRRFALMRYPREKVASLTGNDWLTFLDRSGGDGKFTQGPGRILAEGPYVRDLPEDMETQALTNLVRDWLNRNSGN